MSTCIVPGCTSGYKTNPGKFHFFTIPKDPASLVLWKRAVKREDVKCGHPVCENHFPKNAVIWQREILGVDGRILGVSSYKIPRLAKGTVPSIFPWTEADISTETIAPLQTHKESVCQPQTEKPPDDTDNYCSLPQKRRKVDDDIKKNSTLSSSVQLHQKECDVQEIEELAVDKSQPFNTHESDLAPVCSIVEDETTSSASFTFDTLLATEIKLPSGWLMQKTTCERTRLMILLTHKCINIEKLYKTFILKAVTVTDDLSIQVTVLDKLVNLSKLNFPDRVKDIIQLQELIHTIDGMNVCKGCAGLSVDEHIKNGNWSGASKDITETWRHHGCSLLLSKVTSCHSCRTTQKTLATKFRRWKSGTNKKKRNSAPNSPTQRKEIVRLRGKLRAAKASQAKARGMCKSLQEQLKFYQARIARCANLDPDELLRSGKISENQVHVLQQIIDAAKRKNSKGRNYSEEWMLLCMLLHMRSSSGYEFLRSNEILPLPCVRTIRRYLSKINSRCGFDPQFFEVFKTALEKKDESQRHGILLLDEMSTRESVTVDTKNLTYKGLIDFGEDQQQQPPDFSQKANHGLVLMYHSLNDTFTQPIAVFASRGPAKGDVLAKLIIKAIILLEGIGAKVHGVVSDGAAPNRKFWSEVGASGARNGLRNYFDHPVVEGRKVFIFSDTPHLIKTIRNRLHNNKEKGLQMSPTDPVIKWEYIKTLQESDKQLVGPGQNLVCPKLTPDHVNLNNALKMRVRLAVQVFSNSVAVGLRFYENKVPDLKGSGGTASFCKWMNDMFDALNRTNPIDGVRVGNIDYKIIAESLRKLDAWEEHVERKELSGDLFLTKQTAEGLRVTLQSSLDLIRYLTENCGFQYVLTGRINQDPLERFFGTVRQAGGCNDHPSTPTFLHIYKILSTYSVLKPPKAGNCSVSSQQATQPLVTLAELKSIYNFSNTSVDVSKSIKQKLEQVVKHDEWSFEELFEHDYCMPQVKDCVLYCLTAELTKRIMNTVKCLTCKEALIVSDTEGVILPEAVLSVWQERANLIHPNSRLFRFVLFLEKQFDEYCQSANVFEDIIDAVCKHDGVSFPCTVHGHEVIYQITQYFVRMRMQQHCRRLKAEQLKTNQFKKKSSKFCVT